MKNVKYLSFLTFKVETFIKFIFKNYFYGQKTQKKAKRRHQKVK